MKMDDVEIVLNWKSIMLCDIFICVLATFSANQMSHHSNKEKSFGSPLTSKCAIFDEKNNKLYILLRAYFMLQNIFQYFESHEINSLNELI